MIPFLVSYQPTGLVAIVIADGKTTARDFFQKKFLSGHVGVDKRKIATTQLKDLDYAGPELTKPKVLKIITQVEG